MYLTNAITILCMKMVAMWFLATVELDRSLCCINFEGAMLVVVNEVLNAAQLAACKRNLQQGQWQSGTLTAGLQSAQVKNNLQLPENDLHAVKARQEIMKALSANGEFFSAVLPKKIFPLMFNRYTGEQNSFGSHVDNAVRTPANGGPWVRTDVSATLFLSAPNEYEGGALVIQDAFGEQRIKLAAGDMVLYPASSVHRVEPVTHGERWACFFWVESMVRTNDQRRTLYELDQSIVQLRGVVGDTPPIVQLTAVYHNLLRQWAQT
jgi:PKHD-type hydroxylase